MYVRVGTDDVSLEEPDDLKRFKVSAAPGVADVSAVLSAAGFGRLAADGDALVSVAALRRAADGRVAAGWDEQFDGMLSYARSKGWVTEDGEYVQAHVETDDT